MVRASLTTLFFHWIFNFPRENKLISLGKMKNPLENRVSRLALIHDFAMLFFGPPWILVLRSPLERIKVPAVR
jgi:hypothetical protein